MLDDDDNEPKHYWYGITPSWNRREFRYVHWGVCSSSIIPPGAVDHYLKEEDMVSNNSNNKEKSNDDDHDNNDDDNDDDETSSVASVATASTSAYKVNGEYSDESTLVHWHSSSIKESPFDAEKRKEMRLRLIGMLIDFISLLLVAALIDQTYIPGPVNPTDNLHIIIMTGLLGFLWLSSLFLTSRLLKGPKRSSCLFKLITILSNIGVALAITPLVYSMATSTTADHFSFRLLPCGSLITLSLVWKLDIFLQPFTSKIQLYFYRGIAVLFVFSWIVGNIFTALHDREDRCSPSILWLHAMLLLLGGGVSSEEIGCLITEQSSVSKLIVASTGVCLLHVIAFTTLLKHIYSNGIDGGGVDKERIEKQKMGKWSRNGEENNADVNDESEQIQLYTKCITSKWLKRRRLILFVYSPSSKSNEDEILYDFKLLLKRILMHEESYSPGCAISILWVGSNGSDEILKMVKNYLCYLIRSKENSEWMNRVAFRSSSSSSLPTSSTFVPNTSDLVKSGVEYASHVLLPTFSKIPIQSSDDITCLYVTAIRSMAQEDTIITCEIHWSENKLVALEAGANHIICLNELQLGIMGRCVGAPGMADLITELIGGQNSNEELGGGATIVPFHVPLRYRELPFCEAAYHMFNEFGITMIAINATIDEKEPEKDHDKNNNDISSSGSTEVPILNPSHRMIVGNSCCFGISPNWKATFEANNVKEELINEYEIPPPSNVNNDNKSIKENDTSKKNAEPPKTRPKSKDATELLLSKDLLKPTDISKIVKRPMRRGAPWKRPSKLLKETKRSKMVSGLTLLMRSDPNNAWRIGEDVFDAGRPMWSIVGKNRSAGINSTPDGYSDEIYKWHELDDAVQSGLKNHVLVILCDNIMLQHGIHRLVHNIRSQERETWVPIVIVSELPPSIFVQHGNDVGDPNTEPPPSHSLPHVYWVPSDNRTREGLLRAGITTASNVIVCPCAKSTTNSFSIQMRIIQLCRVLAPNVSLTTGSTGSTWTTSKLPLHRHMNDTIDRIVGPTHNVSLSSLSSSLLYQYVHNPFIGSIISNIIKGGHSKPPLLRESDRVAMMGNSDNGNVAVVKSIGSQVTQKSIYFNSILSFVRTSLRLHSRIRSSFVRVRGIPTYLHGQEYLKLFEFCVYSDGGTVPIGILRRDKETISSSKKRGQVVSRHLILNMKKKDLIHKDDCYIVIIPTKYNHLLKRKHLLEKSMKDKRDGFYSRQLNERTIKLIIEQIDVIVDIKVRMQQAYDSRETNIKEQEERKKSGLSAKKKKTAKARSELPEEQDENKKDVVKDEETMFENQDLATQVISLLRSTTSLLSILTWRQKRTITLRGDTTIPGATLLMESQKMYTETCMSDSLIEMMKERDFRIREIRKQYQKDIKESNEESEIQSDQHNVIERGDDE